MIHTWDNCDFSSGLFTGEHLWSGTQCKPIKIDKWHSTLSILHDCFAIHSSELDSIETILVKIIFRIQNISLLVFNATRQWEESGNLTTLGMRLQIPQWRDFDLRDQLKERINRLKAELVFWPALPVTTRSIYSVSKVKKSVVLTLCPNCTEQDLLQASSCEHRTPSQHRKHQPGL